MPKGTSPLKTSYIVLALVFILVETMIVIRNWVTDYWLFYWFCDFAPIVFALCFSQSNPQSAKGLMYIGLFGQLIYAISFFFSLLFFGVPFLGFEIPVFTQPLDSVVTVIMHLATFAVLIISLNEKPKPIALAYAMGFLIVIYATVLMFTTPHSDIGMNYNYIYSADALWFIPYYTAFWIPITFLFVVPPTYGCDWGLYRLRH